MIPPRSSIRRIPGMVRPLRPPSKHMILPFRPRLFTNRPQLLLVSPLPTRPQLPFLSPLAGNRPLPPLSTHLRQHFARLISTERRNEYKRRLGRGLRIALTVYAILCMFHLMKLGIYQEEIEHKWPTPPEWTWKSRWCLRSAEALQHPDEIGKLLVNWPMVAGYLRALIERLEDLEGEGKGILEQDDGGLFVDGVGKTGYDVSMKSEPWRRGYFQALMGAAKAAESLEGWLTDWKIRVTAPAEYVHGPSNPHPKPHPAGQTQTLREENCEPATQSPEVFYMRMLTTNGFSTKQKIDAALAYADWLDYKGLSSTAQDMYNWAMDIATAGLPYDAARVVDAKSGILKNKTQDIASENIMRVSTALAVHNARVGNLPTALSIFTSVLQARRALPEQNTTRTAQRSTHPSQGDLPFEDFMNKIKTMFVPAVYPDAPPSGNDPPIRNVGSACEEAGLMTYIGEIIHATSSKDSGLAWTRGAVDLAESSLVELSHDDAAARERCSQCLKVGFSNWKTMVRSLIVKAEKEEAEAIQKAATAWYGGEKRVQAKLQERRRWEAEEMIVQDRANRILPSLFDDEGLGLGSSSSIFS